MRYFLVVVAFFWCLGFSESNLIEQSSTSWYQAPSNESSIIQGIIEANAAHNYDKALMDSKRLELSFPNSPTGCFFYSITLLAKYDDIGNIDLIKQSDNKLNRCLDQLENFSLNIDEKKFWQGVMLFQIGYTQNVLGNSIKATKMMRRGAKLMEDLEDNLDAQAFYSIYAYYIDQLTKGLSWLPFVSDNRSVYIKNLEVAVENSIYFSTLFRTTLCWIKYDEKKYSDALTLANDYLDKYPNHRIYQQIKGDMNFRLNKLAVAAQTYEDNLKVYEKESPYSVRYFSAIGNLARIYQDIGDLSKSKLYASKLNSVEFKKIETYMPNSLLKDLNKRKIIK